MRAPATRIRLVVSDVDGTLVTTDKTLTPASIAAARRLRDAGVALALVSSRPAAGINMLLEPLGIDTPRAGFNGGEIVAPDGSTLVDHTIAEGTSGIVVAALEQAGADTWVFGGGEWLLRNPHAQRVSHEQRATSMDFHEVASFASHLARVHKVMGTSGDTSLIARLEAEVAALVGDAAAVHRSQDFYLDVTHRDANKGAAALALAKLIGVDPTEMACLGDMSNDVPMLDIAGLAIAMGNAKDAVRAHAHEITQDNDSDGWALAIEHFVLPRAR
jgi:Cof subfamily protein (haloacid dehalogenase superfamily)